MLFELHFNDVAFAGEAKSSRPHGERPPDLGAFDVFIAGQVGVFVVVATDEGVGVVCKDALHMDERGAARAVEILVDGGERDDLLPAISV